MLAESDCGIIIRRVPAMCVCGRARARVCMHVWVGEWLYTHASPTPILLPCSGHYFYNGLILCRVSYIPIDDINS